MRHTNREIEEAKMLARRIAALKNVSSPPLSRVMRATTLLCISSWFLLRKWLRSKYMELLERTTCPHCHGYCHKLTHVAHDEFQMQPCKLCSGKGWIGPQERDSVRWGRGLLEFRLHYRTSLDMMFMTTGIPPDEISQHENGLVHLDNWRPILLQRARDFIEPQH
jgi:hypothetical protein